MAYNTLAEFRLFTRNGSKSPCITFACARCHFRSALGNALIDVRLADSSSPVVLEIAFKEAGKTTWLGLPQGYFPRGELRPERVIRWVSIGDLYDYLVRAREAAGAAMVPAGKAG